MIFYHHILFGPSEAGISDYTRFNITSFLETSQNNFIIAATDERPPVMYYYDLDHMDRCGQFDGTPFKSMPNTVKCAEGTYGEYVYYYLPASNYVRLAELEVFGLRKYHMKSINKPIRENTMLEYLILNGAFFSFS